MLEKMWWDQCVSFACKCRAGNNVRQSAVCRTKFVFSQTKHHLLGQISRTSFMQGAALLAIYLHHNGQASSVDS